MKENKYSNNIRLELEDLKNYITSIFYHLQGRPIRKSKIIQMVTETFECNTPSQVEFALLELIDEHEIYQEGKFISTDPDFRYPTPMDEGIINLLCSPAVKDEAKSALLFNVNSNEHLTPDSFFKYVDKHYGSIFYAYKDYATLVHFVNHADGFLKNQIFEELNDYPTELWLTKFFADRDCRIIVGKIESNKKYTDISLILLPNRKGNYKLAWEQAEEFRQHVGDYFISEHINVRTKPLGLMVGGIKREK